MLQFDFVVLWFSLCCANSVLSRLVSIMFGDFIVLRLVFVVLCYFVVACFRCVVLISLFCG